MKEYRLDDISLGLTALGLNTHDDIHCSLCTIHTSIPLHNQTPGQPYYLLNIFTHPPPFLSLFYINPYYSCSLLKICVRLFLLNVCQLSYIKRIRISVFKVCLIVSFEYVFFVSVKCVRLCLLNGGVYVY